MTVNPLTAVKEAVIFVHALSTVGAAYARVLEGEHASEQVFIPQGIANKFEVLPGDCFTCRVVQNHPDRRDTVPWRLVYIYPKGGDVPEAPRTEARAKETFDTMTDDRIRARVEEEALDGRVWTAREMFKGLSGRDPDYSAPPDKHKSSVIGNHLRTLCRHGRIYKMEIYSRTETAQHVYFCTDLEEFTPEGY